MQRTWIFLSIALVAIGVAFLLNIMPPFASETKIILSPGEIEGMAMMYNGKLYTLNFEQQEAMIKIINRSIPVGKKNSDERSTKPNFDKLVIYQFNKPQIILTPVGYVGKNLVFELPEIYPEGYLQEVTQGAFQEMVSKIVEP